MAHERSDVGPAIAGTTTRTKTTRNWLPLIIVLGFLAIIGALLLALNRGIEVGSLVIRQGTGVSMEPLAYDGDSLVTWVRFDLVVGETYLIRDKGQLLHKRLKEIKGDQFVFDSINQEHETTLYRASHNQVLARAILVLPTHFLWDGEGDVAEGRDLGITEEEKRIAKLEGELDEKKETRRVEKVERECRELDLSDAEVAKWLSGNDSRILDGKSETGQTFEVESPRMWTAEIKFSKPQPIRNIRVETTAPITEVEIFDGDSWRKVAELFGGQGGDAAVTGSVRGFRISCGGPTPPGTIQRVRVNEIRCFI